MKLVVLTTFLPILLACTTTATEAPTIEFDPDLVAFVGEIGQVGYHDFEPVSVGRSLTLPGRTYYVALENGQDESAISYNVGEAHTLGSLADEHLLEDMQTRSGEFNPDDYDGLLDPVNTSEALQATGVVAVGNVRWAKLLLLPITVSESGEVQFIDGLTVYLDQEPVANDQLMQSDPAGSSHAGMADRADLSVSSEVASYLIITAPHLAAPMQRLAWYKNSIGCRTSLAYIDEILAIQTGRDEAEQLRNYLTEFYAQGGSYVLLAGDATVLPIRYAYHRAVDEAPPLLQQQVSDLYFADLSGEWDLDNDNVWGERTHDQADLTPELMVGRLPFNTIEQFDDYVDKLIAYETEPGGDEREYLDRAFFFSSDQMRDYSGGGQHARIALAYPDHFGIDTAAGVELTRGDDPDPHNALPRELEDVLSDGYGIVNIIAHGTGNLFEVRTSGYNNWPKTRFTTDTTASDNGAVGNLTANGKTSFYYSLACDNGAFDYDYSGLSPNFVVSALAQPKAGAVAFVANSRWGWVGSSHLLQKAFFDSMFAHRGRAAVEAMYGSKLRYYYVRDVVYGQNFYGDPTVVVYDQVPGLLDVDIMTDAGSFEIDVTSGGQPVAGCLVTLSDSTGAILSISTSQSGDASFEVEYSPMNSYTIAAVKGGFTVTRRFLSPAIAADVDELVDDNLPLEFSLSQNYPNPFNPTTTILLELPHRTNVSLSIYNVLGQHVAKLIDGPRSHGTYEVTWDGRNNDGRQVTSGVYFYRLITDNHSATKKLMLLR
ncbi:MAG: C25 family cysteine peptidase [candidate division Zixibacteria bacterium]|nr:C25 family cysteine peptidase [candidate division Zixibacteria bacterium]MDH3935948.1 C25 family cysteine peptidase [candidate division Zixibacteria bacterium]MDH4033789.1 C25 family cysteine peptidase [candidate division Zixibacteria bacterium]